MHADQAKKFDELTLSASKGLDGIYSVDKEMAKALKAHGISDRTSLTNLNAHEQWSTASHLKLNRGVVRTAVEVATLEKAKGSDNEPRFNIHVANLIHKSGYRTAAAFDEARTDPQVDVEAAMRAANGTEKAWDGNEGCNEFLNLSMPEVMVDLHRRFLKAGSQALETNTFGSSRIVLAEYGLEHAVELLNQAAVLLEIRVSDDRAKVLFKGGSVGEFLAFQRLQALYDHRRNTFFGQADQG